MESVSLVANMAISLACQFLEIFKSVDLSKLSHHRAFKVGPYQFR